MKTTTEQKKKKKFIQPKIEIIEFETEDILVMSSLPPLVDEEEENGNENIYDNMAGNGWT